MCPSSTHGGVQAKSVETHVLTFIWYAANKTCLRDVANRLDMSESTMYRVLQRVALFLMTLRPSVIKFPADLESLTSSFEKDLVKELEDELEELEGNGRKYQYATALIEILPLQLKEKPQFLRGPSGMTAIMELYRVLDIMYSESNEDTLTLLEYFCELPSVPRAPLLLRKIPLIKS
ncbi:hypothetical protein MRX96_002103 [Rhipicephalus microplus]